MKQEQIDCLFNTLFEEAALTKKNISTILSKRFGELAKAFVESENFTEASLLYIAAIEIAEHSPEVDDLQVATWSFGLANIYVRHGRCQDAEAHYLKTIQIWEHQFGKEHKLVGFALHGYANLLRKLNRELESRHVLQRAASIMPMALPFGSQSNPSRLV